MKIRKKMNSMIVKCKTGIYNFFHDEKGDTNFISILVILAIVTVLIALFLAFKEEIVGWVEETMDKFWE